MRILYIGGFQFPDKNPASARVIGNAKVLRDLGHEVEFLSDTKGEQDSFTIKNYFDFKCFEFCKKYNSLFLIKKMLDISTIERVIYQERHYDLIIGYELPAIVSLKLVKICKKLNVKYILDITEWESVFGPLYYRIGNLININLNMRYINKLADGIIVVSTFLDEYYRNEKPTILIPPLVDVKDEKWNVNKMSTDKSSSDKINLIYAGSGGKRKEKLNEIVNCLEKQKEGMVFCDIIGLTKEEYLKDYNQKEIELKYCKFHGRKSHDETLSFVKNADYSLIIRPSNRKTQAGFPTKFVESVTLGTKIIATDVSDLKKYIKLLNNGLIIDKFDCQVLTELEKKPIKSSDIFDYRHYKDLMLCFINMLGLKDV